MITVRVKRHSSGTIESVMIDGHAGFADPGEDIVCAAVSGISFGMINAASTLLGIDLPVKQNNGGFLHVDIPSFNKTVDERLQLIMDAMIGSLQSVADEYGKYIKVYDMKVNRRWIEC